MLTEVAIQRFIALTLIMAIVLANIAEKRPLLRNLVYVLLVTFHGLFIFRFLNFYNYMKEADPTLDIDTSRMGIGLLLLAAFATVGLLMLVRPVRQVISRFFPRRETVNQDGIEVTRGFDPNSIVHTVALVGCNYLLAITILEFVLSGGLAGLAETFSGVSTELLWIQAIIMIFFALIGVGIGVRRGLASALARLGLRFPTLLELFMGIGMACVLVGLAFMVNITYTLLTPRDVVEQQTILSQQIGNSVTTLMMGFMLALTASLGEEIAFRGALQPIFGLVPTALLFALIHIQYTLTPASLLILAVGVGFGILRKYYNTTTAILAHFLYNFILVALLVFARYGQTLLGGAS